MTDEDAIEIEEDPLYKVKSHGGSCEPIDFETYRGLYEDSVEQTLQKAEDGTKGSKEDPEP